VSINKILSIIFYIINKKKLLKNLPPQPWYKLIAFFPTSLYNLISPLAAPVARFPSLLVATQVN